MEGNIEALWSAEFLSSMGNMQSYGAGIVVLETGRVFGGDSQYFYVGDYRGGGAQVKIDVTHYAGPAHSIFGGPVEKFSLELSGTPSYAGFDLHGHVSGRPELKIIVRLTRRAELP